MWISLYFLAVVGGLLNSTFVNKEVSSPITMERGSTLLLDLMARGFGMIYLLSIKCVAANTEFMGEYIINWPSIYANNLTVLSQYNYRNNISIEVSRATPSGSTDGYNVIFKSGDVESVKMTYSLARLI